MGLRILAALIGLVGWTASAAAQRITEYVILPPLDTPDGIATGPDGALWFVGPVSLWRITTSGTFIAAGPDGALWFTAGSKMGRITTSGTINSFAVPTPDPTGFPSGIAAGPDRGLWFTGSYHSKIGRITTSGIFTEFPTPTSGIQR